ncbi:MULTISPECIES: hypothetical protein [Sphingobacterium]|uniref:Lipoprotein n=1 Tax=Sphingobacterium cellulitidis TaxID=1768011 RepID=A0A8H9KVS8_9SPHI|nr:MULTISPECIES: hypothetical protein [Sphingobacterium]MBA8987682.1 major membrane immunogen (membrane-anchored lipoprotein) [Sphingobacterium soli]WFB64352.1 hypothetical protein PZ892_03895 [Sphingobacterium sp. WM]GGE22196.1 hypothetical protein GCM10011516_19830 [Sphingobacterium soli]
MKLKNLLFLFLITFLSSSCEKDDIEFNSEYESSLKAFKSFKAQNNNSYRYVVSGDSYAGFSWETTITVKNGTVVKREYQYLVFNRFEKPANGWTENDLDKIIADGPESYFEALKEEGISFLDILSFTEENGKFTGQSKYHSAFSTITLDEIYERAKNKWLIKNDKVDVFFENNNNGMISLAGFWPKGCMDDCFSGVKIKLIEPLK